MRREAAVLERRPEFSEREAALDLTGRFRELAERYATPLPMLTDEVAPLALRMDERLAKMGAPGK